MKIGLEIHVQLPTRSKMFCSCPTTDAESPNTHVCPTCLGMPGSRPSMNKKALEYGIMLSKMLNCTIADTTWFSRKTYFYPDMCKNVQITQYDHPVGIEGMYYLNGKKPIRITRVQLEEDPGKTKRVGDQSSLVDYNRSGIPLVEIVTEPDLATPSEAREFLGQLISDIRHTLDLSEEGERSIRCDCNISVGKERCEVKNVTGLKNVERALTFELIRQTKLLKAGSKIDRETRRFDEERGVTISVRKKELEADYGYIDEPDLGIFDIKELSKNIKIKESPLNMYLRLSKEYNIDESKAKQLVSTSIELANLFEKLTESVGSDIALTWATGTISANWKYFESEDFEPIISAIINYKESKITDIECDLLIKSYMTGKGIESIKNDSVDLNNIIKEYLDTHPEIKEDYKKNEKAINKVMGHVIKETCGTYSSSDIISAIKTLIK